MKIKALVPSSKSDNRIPNIILLRLKFEKNSLGSVPDKTFFKVSYMPSEGYFETDFNLHLTLPSILLNKEKKIPLHLTSNQKTLPIGRTTDFSYRKETNIFDFTFFIPHGISLNSEYYGYETTDEIIRQIEMLTINEIYFAIEILDIDTQISDKEFTISNITPLCLCFLQGYEEYE